MDKGGEVYSSPALYGATVYVGSDDKNVYAIGSGDNTDDFNQVDEDGDGGMGGEVAVGEIGDEGIIALANSKKFPELVSIALDNNFASIEGKEEAKVGRNFKKLQSLNL